MLICRHFPPVAAASLLATTGFAMTVATGAQPALPTSNSHPRPAVGRTLADAGLTRAAPAGVGLPATPAGAQARWLLGALARLPIPRAEIEAHFDAAFLAHASPAAINADIEGIAPVRLVSVSISRVDEVVFIVEAKGPKAPSPRLQVLLAVDTKGLICGLGVAPAPASGSAVPPTLIGGGCLAPASAKASLCYSPQAVRAAYGIAPLTARGLDGKGRTVAVVDIGQASRTPGTTNPYLDLAAYDRYFRLPAARLEIVTRFDPSASATAASDEEAGDVEIVHAIAPGADVRVVLVPAPPSSGLGRDIGGTWLPAWRYAIANADVVSFSGGGGEHCFTASEVAALHSVLEGAVARRVTVIASSGDMGPLSSYGCTAGSPMDGSHVRELIYPASDPLVLAVGGTSLSANPATGAYEGETVWAGGKLGTSTSFEMASGGGPSHLFARPSYQDGVAAIGTARAVPDVSADADGAKGLAGIVVTADGAETVGPAGGTSASAPIWAGLVAIVDQYAGQDLGLVNPVLYAIGKSAEYHEAFHDITQGNTTVRVGATWVVAGYKASPGWDMATGWGSPDASVLVPLLARNRDR
jgi:hypothetical protein